ncbi:MAG: protein kinase, partial [Myxococcota bacterium]
MSIKTDDTAAQHSIMEDGVSTGITHRKQPLPLKGVVLDGRYRMERPIAAGGHGQVWRGIQLSVERPVAIKVLLPQHLRSTRERRRFKREARYACRLSHPNLATYHEYGHDTEHNIAYIVVELIEGRTISQELMVVRPMDMERVCV